MGLDLGSGDDKYRGEPGKENVVAGNAGDDHLRGRGKSDLLLGGKGNDKIFGANGHDELYGGQGKDYVNGGNGRDTVSGGRGDNTLKGGNGNDTFVINADLAGEGRDTIVDFDVDRQLRKMTFNDTLLIKNVGGQEFCFQQIAENTVELTIDGNVVATINGSGDTGLSAIDLLLATRFEGGSPKFVKLLDSNDNALDLSYPGTTGDDYIDAVPGIDQTISGNAGNDTIDGAGKNDFLLGNNGDDVLLGRNGHDTLFGGGDDDMLNGGNGGDVLSGDKGSDELTGGNGNDTFVLNSSHSGIDKITDYVLGEDVVQVKKADGNPTYNSATGEISDDGGVIAIVANTPTDVDFI